MNTKPEKFPKAAGDMIRTRVCCGQVSIHLVPVDAEIDDGNHAKDRVGIDLDMVIGTAREGGTAVAMVDAEGEAICGASIAELPELARQLCAIGGQMVNLQINAGLDPLGTGTAAVAQEVQIGLVGASPADKEIARTLVQTAIRDAQRDGSLAQLIGQAIGVGGVSVVYCAPDNIRMAFAVDKRHADFARCSEVIERVSTMLRAEFDPATESTAPSGMVH